jgi:hypothetical protein
MKLAILYNPRPDADSDALDDAFEEYAEPKTIAAIADALAEMGVEPIPVIADTEFPWRLKHGGFDFVFNIAEGGGRRCREAVPAAICEFLGLPFTGSDALTLAITLDKAVARRIVSPDVPVARGRSGGGPGKRTRPRCAAVPRGGETQREGSRRERASRRSVLPGVIARAFPPWDLDLRCSVAVRLVCTRVWSEKRLRCWARRWRRPATGKAGATNLLPGAVAGGLELLVARPVQRHNRTVDEQP